MTQFFHLQSGESKICLFRDVSKLNFSSRGRGTAPNFVCFTHINERERERGHRVFYKIISDVTYHHFPWILLVTQRNLVKMCEVTTQRVRTPGRWDHWGTSWGLAAEVPGPVIYIKVGECDKRERRWAPPPTRIHSLIVNWIPSWTPPSSKKHPWQDVFPIISLWMLTAFVHTSLL